MGFVFAKGEPIGDACFRVIREESEGAVEKLSAFAEDPDLVIHEVRKHSKRIRSILQVLRTSFGKKRVAPVNAMIRDAAKVFSDARDALVMTQTCEALQERYEMAGDEVLSRLQQSHRDLLASPGTASLAEQAAGGFREAMVLIEDWPRGKFAVDGFFEGVGKNYRRGQKDFAKALESRCPEECHDWRKRSKYLTYHLTLLSGRSEEDLSNDLAEATKLGSLLGEHHDLEVLKENLEEKWPRIEGAEVLLQATSRRQGEIEEEAFAAGAAVFGLDLEAFRDRIS